MMGGGEFIVNGAERVIVSQLHRSPGVDFSIVSSEADRPLHSARIIPERGSWIELEVTKKDVLAMRIDQSTKLAATTFLRCLDESVASTDAIISLFYEVRTVKPADVKPRGLRGQRRSSTPSRARNSSTSAARSARRGRGDPAKLAQEGQGRQNPSDPLILNTIAEEKLDQFDAGPTTTRRAAEDLRPLRPGNPPQVDKAMQLFQEKFFDDNRYRLGQGRALPHQPQVRPRRPRGPDVHPGRGLPPRHQYISTCGRRGPETAARRAGGRHRPPGQPPPPDAGRAGGRGAAQGLPQAPPHRQERMSVKDPDELAKIADLVNSKSISSAIDFFFGRGELSQVVDQTNPLSRSCTSVASRLSARAA
jgi:DNA-directed RNA polymerase subunit beta